MENTSGFTALPGLVDGSMPLNSPAGPRPSLSGLEAAPVNRSVTPVEEAASPILGISGPSSAGSLKSADLQRSLANRLRALLDENGSPEYSLTWKNWAMPSREPICALRAWVRPTSDRGFTGWHTPNSHDQRGRDDHSTQHGNLCKDAVLAGWPTPTANEMRTMDRERLLRRRQECKERTGNGNGFGLTLGNAVTLFIASTGSTGVLNPAHARWLMGLPPEWDDYAPTETPSSRKSRPHS